MKHSIKQHAFLFLAFVIACIHPSIAQDDCKVLLDPIASQYEGDCKKGLAEGQGTAKGEDTYVGDFKKGLPHGTGTYTWANGDVYEGEFKKGMKEGQGKLQVSLVGGQKKEQTGYWVKDNYIGESKNPYEIINRTPNVLSVRMNETVNPSDDGNAVIIEIQHKGRVQPSPRFELSVNVGSFQNRFPVGNTTKVLVTKFPFGFTLNYMGETVELLFSQETSWKVTIDFNK